MKAMGRSLDKNQLLPTVVIHRAIVALAHILAGFVSTRCSGGQFSFLN